MRPDPVVIALVRPALLGTYGDRGNALVLAKRLEWRGIAAEIIDVDDGAVVPSSADICILGGGEDRARDALIGDARLMQSVTAAHAAGAVLLGVCAGLQILGERIVAADGSTSRGAGILPCVTVGVLRRRAVGDVVADPLLPGIGRLTGFENHAGITHLLDDARPLARIHHGVGNGDGLGSEGVVSHRAVATYLHGPVLARNPDLADHLLEWVVGPLPSLEIPAVARLRRERLRATPRRRWPAWRR